MALDVSGNLGTWELEESEMQNVPQSESRLFGQSWTLCCPLVHSQHGSQRDLIKI